MSTKTYTTPGGTTYTLYSDMLRQPHLLIAGATGSGKSVVVNAIISTAITKYTPANAQFILIDPKRVELNQFRFLPHTLFYASEPNEFIPALTLATKICDQRYAQMQAAKLRTYNGSDIYVIIDEWADLYLTQGRPVKAMIQRLAQIGRASKVHVILCTQTPIAKVLPTEIKCNFDARVGLRTRSAQDSRNILGYAGLETLPRYGKGVYMTPEEDSLYEIPMIPNDHIQYLLAHWKGQVYRNRSFISRLLYNLGI